MKYIGRLIQKDTDQDIEVPEAVLSSYKRRPSPRKENGSVDMDVGAVEDGNVCVGGDTIGEDVDVCVGGSNVSEEEDVTIVQPQSAPPRRTLGGVRSG